MEEQAEYQTLQQEQPLGFAHKDDYVVQLTMREFQIIDEFYQKFALPLSILNTKRDKAFIDKAIVPVFKEDVVDGKIPDVEEFWKKHTISPVAE